MSPTEKTLLLIDAAANLVLGALLLCFPLGVDRLLGLPDAGNSFYPSILGGVIFGIGVALMLARAGRPGLGIDGAIVINVAGAGVLLAWLVLRPPFVPTRGLLTLWLVALVVAGIGVVEIAQRVSQSAGRDRTPTEPKAGGPIMTRDIIATGSAPGAVGPYSQGIRTDTLVFTAGQIPLDPSTGSLVTGTIEDRTRRVLDNVKAVLEAAGTGLDRVVKMTVFMTDLGDFKRMNAVYAEYFPENPPARSAVQVGALPLGADIEMEAVALAPGA